MDKYDIAIIGSGPAGYEGAIVAARAGANVCVIEKGDFGGVCLNTGCIPTKTLVASSKVLRHARRAGEFGIDIDGSVEASPVSLFGRKNRVIDIERRGLEQLVSKSGVAIIRGHASFIDKNTLKVTEESSEYSIYSKNIIIATGSKPAELSFMRYDGDKVVSSEQFLSLEKIPESLLIVGGGYIGCEFASLLAPLGVDVTIVEAMPRLLMGVDEEIVAILTREFKKDKIDIRTNSKIAGAKIDDKVTLSLEDGSDISGDMALVAVGRRPLTDGLDLDKIGIDRHPNGAIKVDNHMKTNVQGVFAVGDVVGNPMLAHVASAECKVAVSNALGNRLIMDYTVIPAAIYTYPEIASIGLTEAQAREMGMDVAVGKVELRSLGISHAAGEIAGMAKIVSDSVSEAIAGVHIISERATDLIHEVAVSMFHGVSSSELSRVIHAHPTFSEIVLEAAQDVHNEAIHVLKKAG